MSSGGSVTGFGSLPWWCGAWWLVVGAVLHGAAWLAFLAGDRIGWRALRRQALPLTRAAGACFRWSQECAREARMEEE